MMLWRKHFLPLPFLLLTYALTADVWGSDGLSQVQPPPDFTLYLVRHAEKAGGQDPDLTPRGRARAAAVAQWFQSRELDRVWSSDTRRTRATAADTVSAHALTLQIYDPANLPILAEQLRRDSANALVVGHSNTTPDLARLLCRCQVPDMDESEYNLLYQVDFTDGTPVLRVLDQNTGIGQE